LATGLGSTTTSVRIRHWTWKHPLRHLD